MRYIIFLTISAIEDFGRNKVRTFLTSLGILIGVLSVVLIVAFGLGLKKSINDQFESLGSGQLILFPGQVLANGRFKGGGGGNTTVTRFDDRDIETLSRLRELQYVVPQIQKSITAIANGHNEPADLLITAADIFPARSLNIQAGRVFTREDSDRRNKVVVMGSSIATTLYDEPANAVGKKVKIQDQTYVIIGVIAPVGGGGFGGPDFDNYIYLPYKTGYVFNPDKKFSAATLIARSGTDIEVAKKAISTALLRRYKEDDFSVVELSQIQGAVTSIFSILSSVLTGIAAISLLVGGVGIMNIMYVSVSERVKEIGVRRALGARESDIWQFLIEAITLSLFGGLLGLGLAFGAVAIIQQWFPAYIDAQSVAVALGVSSAIGIVFGVFPARKASRLSPIEAIRYE